MTNSQIALIHVDE